MRLELGVSRPRRRKHLNHSCNDLCLHVVGQHDKRLVRREFVLSGHRSSVTADEEHVKCRECAAAPRIEDHTVENVGSFAAHARTR